MAVDAPEDVATGVCERVLSLVGGRAEAVAAATVGTSSLTRFANSRIHQNVTEDLRSVRLAVAVGGGRMARASTTRTDADGLAVLVERALAAAALRPEDPDFPGFAPAAPVPSVSHWDDATAEATPAERASVVAGFVAAGEGIEAAGYCSTSAVTRALVSSTGQRAVGRSTEAQVDGVHRALVGGPHPADGYAQATSVRLADLDGAACGAVAAGKARSGLDPVSLAPGAYEVVLEPKAVAAVMAFPALYGFNGKSHAEGTSFVRVGEAQWDPAVDIWDDATDPRALGVGFDAEGTPRGRYPLVAAGVSAGLTHDRRSARLAGAAPTGHSLGTESFGGCPTHLFLGADSGSAGDLVAGVTRALLVTDFWYNRILDPKTQVVTGLTRNGLFLIEDGELAGPVQNLRYTQAVVGAFGPGRVVALGTDAQLVGDGEFAIMHVPSVRLQSWQFTGNAQG
jgi:predicted Zn-dependent protease